MMQHDSILSGLSQQRLPSLVTPATMTGSGRLDPLSLGVVGMDNRQAVVIDVGTVLTKFVPFSRIFYYEIFEFESDLHHFLCFLIKLSNFSKTNHT